MQEYAAKQGITDFLAKAHKFIVENAPFYTFPGKASYPYYLTEYTEEDKPSQRVYLTLVMEMHTKGHLTQVLTKMHEGWKAKITRREEVTTDDAED